MRQALFDYQEEALARVRDLVRKGARRMLIVAPTGAGKTTIAAELIHGSRAKNKRTAFMAHRKELITQCSRRLDDWSVDHGILQGNHPRYRPRELVQVCSVQTLNSRIKNPKSKIEANFDLIIVDEAHRSTAPTYEEVFDAHPASTVIIGLTATPARLSGKPLGLRYEEMIVVAHPDELCEKINPRTGHTYLIEPDIYAPQRPEGLSSIRVKRSTGDYDSGELTVLMDKPKLVGGIIEHHASIVGRGKRSAVFATSVAHAEHIRDAFTSSGVPCGHINGKTPGAERDDVLRRFRSGELEVVTNVEILTEGWDLPELDAVILARPTKSLVLYLQMVGRVLRWAKGKTTAIVIDHADNVREHLFPTMRREWQLDGPAPKKKEDALPVKNCPNCAFVVMSGTKTCPSCGYEWESKTREEIEHEEGQLIKMSKDEHVRRQEWLTSELGFAKRQGFKDGFAWHKYREKFGEFPSPVMKTKAKRDVEQGERKSLDKLVERLAGRF